MCGVWEKSEDLVRLRRGCRSIGNGLVEKKGGKLLRVTSEDDY